MVFHMILGELWNDGLHFFCPGPWGNFAYRPAFQATNRSEIIASALPQILPAMLSNADKV
jgi:hypothetical protein